MRPAEEKLSEGEAEEAFREILGLARHEMERRSVEHLYAWLRKNGMPAHTRIEFLAALVTAGIRAG